MKLFIINGSPRGTQGYTHKVIELFAEGARAAGAEVTIEQLAQKKIHHCTGELACWMKTPGECIHKDDMTELLPQMTAADGIIFASPVYVDGMTGLLKNYFDRSVPTVQPFMELRDDHIRHPSRHGKEQRIGLISVCGFLEMDNFDPLVGHIKAICKNMNSTYAGAVLLPAAPAWNVLKFIHPFKFRKMKAAVRVAGKQFVTLGNIHEDTTRVIAQPMCTKKQYIDAANKGITKKLKNL